MTTPPPTAASLVRNVLQAVVGLLDLSTEEEVQVQIPRFYLAIWQQQLETLLLLLEDPFHPTAPAVLIGGTLVAFVTGLVLGLTLAAGL